MLWASIGTSMKIKITKIDPINEIHKDLPQKNKYEKVKTKMKKTNFITQLVKFLLVCIVMPYSNFRVVTPIIKFPGDVIDVGHLYVSFRDDGSGIRYYINKMGDPIEMKRMDQWVIQYTRD